MRPLNKVITNKDTSFNPIWIMRQAGRYLPEFREIRKENPNFINLCLNDDLSSEITLQPLKRFDLDAAIIFSDILMLPYGLGQKVEFEKNFGPKLGELNLNEIAKIDEIDFVKIICLARIMMPKSYVRLSAGRESMPKSMQALCFFAGANSIFYGEELLTTPNNPVEKDKKLLNDLGIRIR